MMMMMMMILKNNPSALPQVFQRYQIKINLFSKFMVNSLNPFYLIIESVWIIAAKFFWDIDFFFKNIFLKSI